MARTSETTKAKTGNNSAKGKSRDKDLVKYDNKKTDETTAEAKALEAFIGDILKDGFPRHFEKAFFTQMIDDVKNGKIDSFTMNDFCFLLKFNNNKNAVERLKFNIFLYFRELCIIAEQEAKQKDEKELILSFENYKKAIRIVELALPQCLFCKSIDELYEIKNGIDQADKEGKEYFYQNIFQCGQDDIKQLEIGAYYYEFLKRMDEYFYDNPVISHYLGKQRHIQNVKDKFRGELSSLDVFYSAGASKDIKSSTLTQSICDYVMQNFSIFFTKYKDEENWFLPNNISLKLPKIIG